LKTTRDYVHIIDAYNQLGSYRAAADLCGTSDKTVKRAVERQQAGGPWSRRARALRRNTDAVTSVIAQRVKDSGGRITAKRLLPAARAAGYQGSARNFRRAVAAAKADWRRTRRSYRPWVPNPGQHLVIDWADAAGGLQMFCAVLAWSRYRFVRFASDESRPTTLALLAECFEELGAVPAVVLSDRMGCLKNGIVANLVVPHPDYLRFAAHFGFRPDFCESQDPESKGVVEHLVGYAKSDLVIPADGWGGRVAEANKAARKWGLEVNEKVHSETMAVPNHRLEDERPLMRTLPSLRPPLCRGELRKVGRLQTVRFASARYSLPRVWVGKKVEVAVVDDEVVVSYDGREIERHPLMAPGEISIKDEHYEVSAGRPLRPIRVKTGTERTFIGLGPVAEAFLRAAAAAGTSRLASELADIVTLELSWGRPQLLEALERALRFRRFKAADVREILAAGPQAPNPVRPGNSLTTLEEFKIQLSSVPQATFDYLAGLEWIRARENCLLIGPAGTGKSHCLLALGHAAVEAGHRVRYFVATDLVETLYRGLADNSVGRLIDGLLRADLILLDELGFAPLDATGGQLLFRFVAAAYERRSLGVASHSPFNEWGRFLPDETSAVSLVDRLLHHAVVVVTAEEIERVAGGRESEEPYQQRPRQPRAY